MPRVTVKLKMSGIQKTLREAQPAVTELAKGMANNAGEGFEAVARPSRVTARAYVQTTGRKGAKRQAEEAVLERALGSAQ